MIDDLKECVCPVCKTRGTLRRASLSDSIRCKNCGQLTASQIKKLQTPKAAPTKTATKTKIKPPNKYPSVPENAQVHEVVDEYWIDSETGERHNVGRVYCPKKTLPMDDIFKLAEGNSDVLKKQFELYLSKSNWAQFILEINKSKFANKRRYMRDLRKRAEGG